MAITVTNPRRSALNAAALTWKGVALSPGTFTEVARYTIPVGAALSFGFGQQSSQDTAVGRIFMDMRDNTAAPGAQQNGKVRFEVHNANDRYVMTLFEARTEQMRTSETDRRQQIPNPEQTEAVLTQNYSLVITMNPDVAFTPGSSNTIAIIDVTDFDAHV